jgi:hypothetical protein
MDAHRFDQLTRQFTNVASVIPRRRFLQDASALGMVFGSTVVLSAETAAKMRCRKNGNRCKKKRGKTCKAKFCLKTPFTIAARWTNEETDHDTYLFVPNDVGADLPSPYIEFRCSSEDTDGGSLYPFAFVSGDAQGPGNEITTITRLLPGRYEYWILLYGPSPTGDLTVDLRNANGRIMRSWSSPPNSSLETVGWHVFDLDGGTRKITSINETIDDSLPFGAHDPNRDVCPD